MCGSHRLKWVLSMMQQSMQQIIRTALIFVSTIMLTALLTESATVHSQDNPTAIPILVEAIQQANLRSGPGVEFQLIGQIEVGTQYPMIGRSAHFPWFLIQLSNTQGWVYADLVKVTGNPNGAPITEGEITPGPSLTPSPSATLGPQSIPAAITATSPAPTAAGNVFVEAINRTNVRYGPGTDFRRVGSISKGQKYVVLRRHVQFSWLEIAYDPSPSQRAWVSQQTVNVTGNILDVPPTSETAFGYPTLTPTAIMVVTSEPPWMTTPRASGDDRLTTLGSTLYDMLILSHFDPVTDRQGSVFITDIDTGQSISLNPGIAYSGVSLMKIPVLLSYYRKFSNPFSREQAESASNMMVCSRNESSNKVLNYLGAGHENAGASYVTDTLQTLGLKDTFLTKPFFTGNPNGRATATPIAANTLKTNADQMSAEPDSYNQTTPADMGWLLSAVYQCAQNGTGPIMTAFNGDVTMQECRQIVNTMRFNKIGSMAEAGLPTDALIAHKHGWSDDTHGDAAIVLTPGGKYVFVAILHNRIWLESDESFPLVAEMSRLTYNTFNPGTPLSQIHLESVPADCTFPDQLVTDLQLAELPWVR
jgi:uncharacterized protein YgiM (DUF1202 family)